MPSTIVVTSVSPPNSSLQALADGARARGMDFLVMGDTKSPAEFTLEGCEFYDVARQEETGFKDAKLCPTRLRTQEHRIFDLDRRASTGDPRDG